MPRRFPFCYLAAMVMWFACAASFSSVSLVLAEEPGRVAFGVALKAPADSARPRPWPVLRTVREVHELTGEEASRGYPVHLIGVVTFCDPNMDFKHTALFLHDATGSLYIDMAPGLGSGKFAIGAVIDVLGTSAPGGFKPIVKPSRIRVIRQASLPPIAGGINFHRPQTGDGWVEVEGVVRSVVESDSYVKIQLAMIDGTITAKTVREPGATYAGLVDAKVRIRANSSPTYNRNRQVVGARLLFPNLSALEVVEPAPLDPFALPVYPIDRLFRFRMGETLEHRVHLHGRVTLQWPGSSLCIRDSSGGLCAQTTQAGMIPVGSYVDMVGFAARGDVAPILTDAVARPATGAIGSGEALAAEPITADQAMLGPFDSKLVAMDGVLIGRDRAASDLTLVLSSGTFVFDAILPKSLAGSESGQWKDGSKVRVTGICSVIVDVEKTARGDGLEVPKLFRILLRSPQDVAVVESPSWWSATHLLMLLTAMVSIALAVTLWGMMLRKRVREQTLLLRESEEKFRYQATHDGLTKLLNRSAILHALEDALEVSRAQRTSVTVAVIDLDHFKQINDTLGHLAGDEVLRQSALRLAGAVRSTDLVGRYGGEEFLVVFHNMEPGTSAVRCETVRQALCAQPIQWEAHTMTITCSIGVASTGGVNSLVPALVASADHAMYTAKKQGRNRVICAAGDLVA